jgi:hypothetical protein
MKRGRAAPLQKIYAPLVWQVAISSPATQRNEIPDSPQHAAKYHKIT